eukprot:3475392-Pyramimonas_sp.AAC.1
MPRLRPVHAGWRANYAPHQSTEFDVHLEHRVAVRLPNTSSETSHARYHAAEKLKPNNKRHIPVA